MTSAGGGSTKGSACDSCHFVDEKMAFLREKRGSAASRRRSVHNGPVQIHRSRAHHWPRRVAVRVSRLHRIENRIDRSHRRSARDPRQVAAEGSSASVPRKRSAAICPSFPCGGGYSVAAHTSFVTCISRHVHKGAFESAVVGLAERTPAAIA